MQNILKGGLEYAIWNGGGGQKRHASDMLQEDVTSVLTCKIFQKFVTKGGGGPYSAPPLNLKIFFDCCLETNQKISLLSSQRKAWSPCLSVCFHKQLKIK